MRIAPCFVRVNEFRAHTGFAPKVMQFISANLCVSAASALNVAAIMVNAESTETQSSQSRVKSYSKTLLGQGIQELLN